MHDLLFNFLNQYVALSEAEKNAIISLDVFHSYPRKTVLLEEGQKSNVGYFVLQGCIRTHYVVDGEEKTTGFYTEMEGLTPHCVLTKEPSEYFITCVEDCILLSASSEMEAEVMAKFPKFETLCRILSEDLLARQQLDFDAFRMASPEQRYRDLAEKRPDLLQRVPQHQLASYLGMTPQSLSRLRSRILKKEKA